MVTYIVTLCMAETYTDSNDVLWWNKEEFTPEVILSYWKKLEGYSNETLTVNKIFLEDKYVMAEVESDSEEIAGYYLAPSIKCHVNEKEVVSVEDITLCDVFISVNYSFDEAKPLTKVEGK